MFFCVEKLFLSGNRDLFDTYLSIYLSIYIYIICIKKIPVSRQQQQINTKKHYESNEFNSTNNNFTRLQQTITESVTNQQT